VVAACGSVQRPPVAGPRRVDVDRLFLEYLQAGALVAVVRSLVQRRVRRHARCGSLSLLLLLLLLLVLLLLLTGESVSGESLMSGALLAGGQGGGS
jgi:hypothetical protein